MLTLPRSAGKNEARISNPHWMALHGRRYPATLLEASLHNRREDWLVHALASGEATQALHHAAQQNSRRCIAGVG